jgi:3-deoxy-D-manno-octulosonate 8-phosphate phosphatase (KDO 8-P phosphatase)
MNGTDVSALASRVRLLLMDVDGVMTDGKLLFVPMPDGSVAEAKAFNAQDGSAIAIARLCGIKLGILSGRQSSAVTRRAEELLFDFCYQNLGSRKVQALNEVIARSGLALSAACYVGDDVQDIPILQRVGFPVAVSNASTEAKATAAYVTTAAGGHGAIREITELILRSQGKWDAAVQAVVDQQ